MVMLSKMDHAKGIVAKLLKEDYDKKPIDRLGNKSIEENGRPQGLRMMFREK